MTARAEWSLIAALFADVTAIGLAAQPPLTFNGGRGWDGVFYHRMAEQFAVGEPVRVRAPFVYRVGTPLLAALVSPGDLTSGFRAVNLVANAISTALFAAWLGLFLRDARVRLLLTAAFVLTWHGPTRFVAYYPVYADPWLFVALLAGLIGVEQCRREPSAWRAGAVGLVVAAGVVFREATLLVAVAFLVAAPKRLGLLAGLPLALGAVALFAVRRCVEQDNAYSFAEAAVLWAWHKPAWAYGLAWFTRSARSSCCRPPAGADRPACCANTRR